MELKDLLILIVGTGGIGIGGIISAWLTNKSKHKVDLLDRAYEEITRQDKVIKELREMINTLKDKLTKYEKKKGND